MGFAKRLGISANSVSRYERGEQEPSYPVFSAYCEVLGIDLNWLLTGVGEMYREPSTAPGSAELRTIDQDVFSKVVSLVAQVHAEEGITLPPNALVKEQSSAYNTLIGRAEDPGDTDELLSLLSWLEARLRKSLKAATAEPGTGKQQA